MEENFIEQIVDEVMMKKVGSHVIFLIRRRVNEKGEFLPGSSPDASKYSTKAFVMPLTALQKNIESKLVAAASNNKTKMYQLYKNEFQLFQSKKGNLWVYIKNGYSRLRELAGRSIDHVYMDFQGKGRYLRNIKITAAGNTRVEIDWDNPELQKIAEYHEFLGAGKSRRLHKIMGLTKEEEDNELKAFVDTVITQKLSTMK